MLLLLPLLLLSSTAVQVCATEGNVLVSVNRVGSSSHGASLDPGISADGRYVVFASDAANLTAYSTDGVQHIFLRDLQTGVTTLVTVNYAGTASANNASYKPRISADGRYVAFMSDASDLVPNDTNNHLDIFVRDMQTQQTTRVSVGSGGSPQSDNDSFLAAISANGRIIAFASVATNLTSVPRIGPLQLYVHDMQTGETKLVSINSAGTAGTSGSDIDRAWLDADGRHVVFQSQASDLVAGDNNGQTDVFVRDLQTNTTTLVSVNMAGTGSGNNFSQSPVISADGRYVAFESAASDLVSGDTNGAQDIFVRDLLNKTTTLVSFNAARTAPGNGNSSTADISSDGRYIVFISSATDLTLDSDNNGNGLDVFVRDTRDNTTRLVSVNMAGTGSGNKPSPPDALRAPRISPDGRFVVFISAATDLAPNDNNGHADIFRRDMQANTTKLLSMNYAGTNSGNSDTSAQRPQISADGQVVAYDSFAEDLVQHDGNDYRDIFAWSAGAPLAHIQFSVPDYRPPIPEGSTDNLTVTRSGNTSTTVTVDYSTRDGSAKANKNYVPISGTLTFLPGETSKTITVKTIDDRIYEAGARFTFSLDLTGTSSNAVLDGSDHVDLNVQDTDSPPSVYVHSTRVLEGPQGSTTEALFKVELLGSSSAFEISMSYTTTDETAKPGSDYVAKNGTLVFEPGETEKIVPVTIIGDDRYEGNETFQFYVRGLSGVAYYDQAVGHCTIVDDDQPRLRFDSPIYEGNENASTPYVITVRREGDPDVPFSVDYYTTDGTAGQRSDYFVSAGTLNFAAGETSKTFSVMLQDDLYVEPDESFTLTLSNPTGVAALDNPNTATFVIHDNDASAPASNPLDATQFFVRQQYMDFLNRPPDAGGLAYWTNQIDKCGTNAQCIHDRRIAVADAFSFEPEFQQTAAYIYRIYRAALGLRPTYEQFINDRSRVVADTNLDRSKSDYALYFVKTAPFRQEYADAGTAAQFVDRMLAVVKNYAGVDLSSQRSALIALYDGTDNGRAAILRAVAENPQFVDAEYNRAFVLMEYFGYLRRDPDQGGFDFWLGQVNKFPLRDLGIQRAMACSFITSTEYQSRFSSIVTHSNRECPHEP